MRGPSSVLAWSGLDRALIWAKVSHIEGCGVARRLTLSSRSFSSFLSCSSSSFFSSLSFSLSLPLSLPLSASFSLRRSFLRRCFSSYSSLIFWISRSMSSFFFFSASAAASSASGSQKPRSFKWPGHM